MLFPLFFTFREEKKRNEKTRHEKKRKEQEQERGKGRKQRTFSSAKRVSQEFK